MPYGIEPKKLEEVLLDGSVKLAVLPEVMEMLNLKAGQNVDEETAKKIVAENDRLNRTH